MMRVQPQIRYLAVVSADPDRLASFYTTQFGLGELGRSDAGDVSLTDGFYNLTLLKQRAGLSEIDDRIGLHHFGLAIDDIHEVEARLEEFAPRADIMRERGDLYHGEYRVFDPNGMAVSLSLRQFGAPEGPVGLPCIRHVAMRVPRRQETLDFYKNVFGFREVSISGRGRDPGGALFAADGHTNLAILVDPESKRAAGLAQEERRMRGGMNHFGFIVPDLEACVADLPPSAEATLPPGGRLMAEYRVFDPDGNGFDITEQQGYEVDAGRWERALARG